MSEARKKRDKKWLSERAKGKAKSKMEVTKGEISI
jgi:hypothetical protein